MKASEIRDLSTQEIIDKVNDQKLALNKMKLNHAISPLENPCKIKETRRFIARLNTEVRKRELENHNN